MTELRAIAGYTVLVLVFINTHARARARARTHTHTHTLSMLLTMNTEYSRKSLKLLVFTTWADCVLCEV